MNKIAAHITRSGAEVSPLEVRQLMVALALSAADDTTLHYVSFLAGRVPVASAFFLHVAGRLDLYSAMLEREAQATVSNFDYHTDQVRQLDKVARDRMGAGTQVQCDVREGDPLEEVLRECVDLQADLLVAGKKSGASAHGILANNLVREAPCSTLVVPQQSRIQIERIFVPVDFSSYSVRALQTAAAIALRLPQPPELVVTHLYELPNIFTYRLGKSEEELKAILDADREAALKDFVNNYAPEAARVRIRIERHDDADLARQISDAALRCDADLIVMGAKGHSRVERLLMGSVTEKLLLVNESIPVWVVK